MVRSHPQPKTRTPKGKKIRDRQVAGFARRLAKDIPLTRLIWFGSRARDEHLLNSDYDFVVVSPWFQRISFVERSAKMYRFWSAAVSADFLCYTPEEFERKSRQIGIVREAVRTGVVVGPR
jgi:predicted nucleotidyltransferase